ncbi:MAG: hypothetical protein QUT27_10240 [candidate division Zixibacteria bacterium]|nr:hypothetical protein [candidate division Zixibacteria bacterium]
MIRVTRHNEVPFEYTAELIRFLESLPGPVTFVNVDGEIMVRLSDEPGRGAPDQRDRRPGAPGARRRARAIGERHAERK